MAVLMSGQQADALAPASTISISAFPFTVSRWVKVPLRGVATYTSRVELLWYDSVQSPTRLLELHHVNGTTDGYANPRIKRTASGTSYTPNADDSVVEGNVTHMCEVFTASNNCAIWVNGTQVATDTSTNKNFFNGGASALDTLFIGGKNPATNEFAFTGHLQDFAIWDGVALGSTEIGQLQNYWADTIPETPSWSWRMSSNLAAAVGGIDLEDVGTSSYTIESDIVALTPYTIGTSYIISGSGGGVVGPNGGLLVR